MISFFLLVVGSVTLVSFLMSPIFKASTKLLLEREIDSEKALLFRMNLPTRYENYEWINSEIEIIKSYPVAMRVVDSLQLHTIDEKKVSPNLSEKEKFDRAVEDLPKKMMVVASKRSIVVEISYESKDPKLRAKV